MFSVVPLTLVLALGIHNSLARTPAAAWAFVRDHWAEALERFPSNTIVRMVESIKLLSTPEQVDDTTAFFAEHPIAQAAKTLDQLLERQQVNTRFRIREANSPTSIEIE